MKQTRQTKQKQLILDVLRAEQPLTATQLYERAVRQCPTLAKSTVYRNLEAMVQCGELCRGFLENGESFFNLGGEGDHHYMICRECNRMQELPMCPVAQLHGLTEGLGFVATDHVVQIYGYCNECAAKHI